MSIHTFYLCISEKDCSRQKMTKVKGTTLCRTNGKVSYLFSVLFQIFIVMTWYNYTKRNSCCLFCYSMSNIFHHCIGIHSDIVGFILLLWWDTIFGGERIFSWTLRYTLLSSVSFLEGIVPDVTAGRRCLLNEWPTSFLFPLSLVAGALSVRVKQSQNSSLLAARGLAGRGLRPDYWGFTMRWQGFTKCHSVSTPQSFHRVKDLCANTSHCEIFMVSPAVLSLFVCSLGACKHRPWKAKLLQFVLCSGLRERRALLQNY